MDLVYTKRPLSFGTLYLGVLAVLAFAWIPALTGSRVGEPLLDALLLLTSALSVRQTGLRKGSVLVFQLFWGLYLLGGALIAIAARHTNPLDFAQAYKFVWYMVLLAPFAWYSTASPQLDIRRLLNVALAMFFTVYLWKRIGGDDRPKLMTENNFEIIFLALLYFSCYAAKVRPRLLQTLVFLSIVALSGSRSAAIAAALVVLFSFDYRSRNAARVLTGLIAALAGVGFAIAIFESRSHGGIESIDRFKFLLMFMESIKSWSAIDYLFGADRLTALPPHVCSQLSYYNVLNSYEGDGSCYSVILHSFNLRIIHDHGILITLLTAAYLMLLTKKAPLHQRLCVLAIVTASGLSVSALNNVFTALGIAIFCIASNSVSKYGSATDEH